MSKFRRTDYSCTPVAKIPLGDLAPQDRVSRHFQWYELYGSEIAARHGIDNQPVREAVRAAMIETARAILEPARVHYRRPIRPNSLYRCQQLERALKKKPYEWVSRSQHTRGQAVDLEIPGIVNLELAHWVAANLPIDQVILECYDARQGPSSGWVHASHVAGGPNRGEVKSYVCGPTGKWVYVPGLRETA